mgnify:CR=1 FL=1
MMIDEVVEKCKKHKQLILMIFLLGLFGYYLIWTISQPYNSCPDEGMKWDICKYVSEHNSIPDGRDESIRNPIWGISYAFQPILTYMICAMFMKIASIFTTNQFALVVSARLVSTISMTLSIYFVITVMALYFICVDKVYILDQVEHHIPSLWVKRVGKHLRDLIKTLGGYLKAEATLILVSFVISLIGLYLFKIVGLNVEYPLLMAIFIGFVDALPILGSGTVMVPWAIICGLNGDLVLGIAIIVLLIIMSTARQFLEPRLVSKHIGVHPIFTLIAMYTGFKVWGILGLLAGPIILIILKNVFASLIDGGVMKTIFDKR